MPSLTRRDYRASPPPRLHRLAGAGPRPPAGPGCPSLEDRPGPGVQPHRPDRGSVDPGRPPRQGGRRHLHLRELHRHLPAADRQAGRRAGPPGAGFGPRSSSSRSRWTPSGTRRTCWRRYAGSHGANPAGWAFLTGTPAEIQDVARRYGVVYRKQERGDVDHTFLTSLVDRAAASSGSSTSGSGSIPTSSCATSRRLLREGGTAMTDWLPRLVARVPVAVHAKLLVAFLAIVVLLIDRRRRRSPSAQPAPTTAPRTWCSCSARSPPTASSSTTPPASSTASRRRSSFPTSARWRPPCASSTSSATTSTGCSSWPRTRWSCSAASARTTRSSSRSSPR